MQLTGDLARRFGGRTIAGLVLVILTIVLIGIVTTFSWWNISSSNGGTAAFYLGSACGGTSCASYQGYPALHDAFALTNTLVLASLALSVFTFIFLALSILWPRLGIGALVTGVVGSILLLVAPVYLYFGLPGAIGSPVNGFFGSYTQPGAPTWYAWGGGTGWFMALVVSGLFIVSTLLAFSAARYIMPLGNVRVSSLSGTSASFTGSQLPFSSGAGQAGARGMFCPTCGSHYPAGTQFCSRDSTALKEIAQ